MYLTFVHLLNERSQYPEMLQALSEVVAKEAHAGTLDNICGALAKLILVNSSLVPLEQVSFRVFRMRISDNKFPVLFLGVSSVPRASSIANGLPGKRSRGQVLL